MKKKTIYGSILAVLIILSVPIISNVNAERTPTSSLTSDAKLTDKKLVELDLDQLAQLSNREIVDLLLHKLNIDSSQLSAANFVSDFESDLSSQTIEQIIEQYKAKYGVDLSTFSQDQLIAEAQNNLNSLLQDFNNVAQEFEENTVIVELNQATQNIGQQTNMVLGGIGVDSSFHSLICDLLKAGTISFKLFCFLWVLTGGYLNMDMYGLWNLFLGALYLLLGCPWVNSAAASAVNMASTGVAALSGSTTSAVLMGVAGSSAIDGMDSNNHCSLCGI